MTKKDLQDFRKLIIECEKNKEEVFVVEYKDIFGGRIDG